MKCEDCLGFGKDIDVSVGSVINTEKKPSETIFFQVSIPLNSIKSMTKIILTHHVVRKGQS